MVLSYQNRLNSYEGSKTFRIEIFNPFRKIMATFVYICKSIPCVEIVKDRWAKII
jgi:hypothetical protein